MKFRPCIDIHDGRVKQIVGGSLNDSGTGITENFVSGADAAFYAALYKSRNVRGGHVILLNKAGTPEYEKTKEQALAALREYPGGLQAGGGINPENAAEFLDAGASHVIVTSYVFKNGAVDRDALKKMADTVGRKRLVLDLSVRKRDSRYMVVTDRWQKFTDLELTPQTLDDMYDNCDEFLIHAVDVEGKASGPEQELVSMLAGWGKCPVTYAGGVHSFEDLHLIRTLGRGNIDVTIGSALDLFGGDMNFEEVLAYCGHPGELQ